LGLGFVRLDAPRGHEVARRVELAEVLEQFVHVTPNVTVGPPVGSAHRRSLTLRSARRPHSPLSEEQRRNDGYGRAEPTLVHDDNRERHERQQQDDGQLIARFHVLLPSLVEGGD